MGIRDWLTRAAVRLIGKSALYDLHPELEGRIPILRVYSDQLETRGTEFVDMAGYYVANSWVHKAVTVWGDSLAGLSTRVVRGNEREFEVVENHPLNTLLENPNPQMSAADLWREWCVCMALGGEIGFEAVRGSSGRANSPVLELWPRQPQQFSVTLESTRYRRPSYYTVDFGDGEPFKLTPDQFIHFKFYNPIEPARGLAPLTAARMGVIIDQMAQAWEVLFFKNNARPDYAVIAPEGLTPSERRDMEVELTQKHGSENAHKPIILERGVTDIKTFGFPPKDLEWVKQREMSRDEIGAVFGVPDEIMGYGRDTYENFETADKVLWTLTIVPLSDLRDDVLTRYFRKIGSLQMDERVKTDLGSVPQLQEDLNKKLQQFETLVKAGYPINIINDWAGLGLPSIAGGDVGYLPSTMVPLPMLAEGAGITSGIALSYGAATTTKALTTAKPYAPEYGSEEHKSLYTRKQRRIDPYVGEVQRAMKRYFQRQQNELVRGLRSSKAFGRGQIKADPEVIPPLGEIYDMEAEIDALIEALRKIVSDGVKAVGQAEIEAVIAGELFDITNPLVSQGIEHILQTVARKVNDTTWNDLIAIFQESEAAGEGIVAMQERLSAYYGDRKSDWQTERIARTTMTGSANYGTREAWRQSGVVRARVWISALAPDRTRETHAEAHGQVRGLDEMYDVGGAQLMYPGDPDGPPEEIINCLCVEQAIVEE